MNKSSTGAVRNLHEMVATKGFGVPALVLRRIEELRTRAHGERPYIYYIEERFRELMYLRRMGGRWSMTNRRMLPNTIRSAYIDFLDAQWQKGVYVSSGVDASLADVIADPNFALYARWKLRTDSFNEIFWTDHVREIENLIASECKTEPVASYGVPKSLTNSAVHDYAKSVAEIYLGGAFIPSRKLPALVKAEAAVSLFSLELQLADEKLIVKRGNIQCLFNLVLADEGPWQGNLGVKFFLEDLLIGGDWYCRSDRDLRKVALAVGLYLTLIGIISDTFREWDFGVE
jgi:hypothetical protein